MHCNGEIIDSLKCYHILAYAKQLTVESCFQLWYMPNQQRFSRPSYHYIHITGHFKPIADYSGLRALMNFIFVNPIPSNSKYDYLQGIQFPCT